MRAAGCFKSKTLAEIHTIEPLGALLFEQVVIALNHYIGNFFLSFRKAPVTANCRINFSRYLLVRATAIINLTHKRQQKKTSDDVMAQAEEHVTSVPTKGESATMNHPEYQKFYDEFYKRLSQMRDGTTFRKECERIQDELEEEQRQTEKAVEKLTGRSAAGVRTAYSPHQAARERLTVKQAAVTAAMLDLQGAYEVRTFSADVVRPKVVTKGIWHLIWEVPLIALLTVVICAFVKLLTFYTLGFLSLVVESLNDTSVIHTISNLITLVVGVVFFVKQLRLARRGE